ncbi:MAG TPA: serine hydrolase [Acidobacteriaceae bacterium]
MLFRQCTLNVRSIFLLCAAAWAQTPAQLKQNQLETRIQAIASQHRGSVALFAQNLKTGQTVALKPDEPVQTASVIKLVILYEAIEQVRSGKAHLEDQLTLHNADQVPGSGVLLFLDTPATLTLKDALTMMIIMSDNTATNLVIDHLGLASINARAQKLGLNNTFLYKKVFQSAEGQMPADQKRFGLGKTTPREMAEVMRKIVTCDLGEPGAPARPDDQRLCGVMLHMLRNQFYRGGIPRYVEGVDATEASSAIANKTGALDAVRNDVAAVSSKNGVLILSIFTYNNQDHSWSSDNEGEISIAKLAKAIVTAWSPAGLASFDLSSEQKPK